MQLGLERVRSQLYIGHRCWQRWHLQIVHEHDLVLVPLSEVVEVLVGHFDPVSEANDEGGGEEDLK